MFIRYIYIPHLEDIYLDLGPDRVALCNREFVLEVNTNSSSIRYAQTSGEPMSMNLTDPFNPIINIEQVKGRFVLEAYGDDDTYDSVNILSGPISVMNTVTQTTKTGLPPVSVSLIGIYTQKINQFFRWRDTGGRIKWGNINFMPESVTTIRTYRLIDGTTVVEAPQSSIVSITNESLGLEVKYTYGGKDFSRAGNNWGFANQAQTDERWEFALRQKVISSSVRTVFIKSLQTYIDKPDSIRQKIIHEAKRTIFTVRSFNYKSTMNSLASATKGSSSRTINTDRMIS